MSVIILNISDLLNMEFIIENCIKSWYFEQVNNIDMQSV